MLFDLEMPSFLNICSAASVFAAIFDDAIPADLTFSITHSTVKSGELPLEVSRVRYSGYFLNRVIQCSCSTLITDFSILWHNFSNNHKTSGDGVKYTHVPRKPISRTDGLVPMQELQEN